MVTVKQVVASAEVSRATFYFYFADKHDLLAAVIARESERIVTDDWVDDHEGTDVRETLIGFGRGLLTLLADTDTMRFEQIVLHMTQFQPAAGAALFAAGPGRARQILQRIIRAGMARGALRAANAEHAANDLMGLWQGCWRLEVMYGQRTTLDDHEIERSTLHGVDTFLRGYAVGN